jgi:translocation protein SEC62
MWICGYEFWIFPRLFDESLTVVDSFKPVYQLEKGQDGQGYYRIGMLIALAAFCGWVMTQPTDFDSFITAQKEFVDDLYSGNLLADVAHNTKENIGRQRNRVPNIDDLLREIELDELTEKVTKGDNYEASDLDAEIHEETGDEEVDGEENADSIDDLLSDETLDSLRDEIEGEKEEL